MKKSTVATIIVVVALLICAVWYFYPSGPTSQITRTANIPYHESGGLEVGVGSAGTLYCEGNIWYSASGSIDYIELTWKADVIFPSNSVAGYISWGDTWIGYEDAPMSIWPPTGGNKWINDKNLDTIWELKMVIYSDDIHFIFQSTTDGVHDDFWGSELWGSLGYEDVAEGEHNIFSAFASEIIPTDKPFDDMSIQIQTPPFKLVRSGDNFWFE